jgi:hypothetical protein
MRILVVLALIGTMAAHAVAGQTTPSDAPIPPDPQAQTTVLSPEAGKLSEQPESSTRAEEQTPESIAPVENSPEPSAAEVPAPKLPLVANPPASPVASANGEPTRSPDAPKAKDLGMLLFVISIGLIPAFIAKRKGRSFWGWWAYGTFLWLIAIPHAILGKTKAQLDAQRQAEAEAQARANGDAENRRQAAIARLAQMRQAGDHSGFFREKLRQYSHHSPCDCMECGYSGYMGIVDQKKPLHENGLLQLAAFMGTGPARNWYAASAFLGGVAKNILECPNCGNRLEQETGSRPKMVMIGR